MKKIPLLLVLICILTGIAVIDSCKKEPVLPTLTTSDVTNVTINSVTSGGSITKDGGAAVTARGVCWATVANPAITDSFTSDSKGTGSFTSAITGLTPNTLYHIRAYATNKAGTAYGNDVSFTTTSIVVATLTTTAVTAVTLTAAATGGNITADGNGDITARGVCWSTTTGPTITNDKTTDGTGTGSFTSNLTGLLPGTTYFLRAYATNSAGTAYGNEVTFATSPILVPTLTTAVVTSITLTGAVSGGNITDDGGGTVTARGVCWATTANPTITNSKTSDATGTGIFVSNLTGLLPGTAYHIRAYATNSAGTAYGNDIAFTTTVALPTLTTTAATLITQTTATSGGIITADGGGAVTARGVCWATTANPTTTNSKTSDGTGTGTFVSNLTGLISGTVYHVRAYATNSAGTAYGNDINFTASAMLVPTLTTTAVTSITTTTATSGGSITADGGGAITARGVCWSTAASPTTSDSKTSDATGTGTFVSNITGLLVGTTYHVRAYATNGAGTAYGNDLSFTTIPSAVPTVTTTAVTSVTTITAVSGGNITPAGAGVISARGTCWATTANPTISDSKTSDATGTGTFTSNLTGLLPGTTYYIRAYATNSVGTGYGNQIVFNTKISDVDGSSYNTVTIGTQVWMAENLKTTKYRDGSLIGTTPDPATDISGETAPSYQWAYGGNETNVVTYGRLYTYYAVTDARGVCPTGWHVPSDAEWTTLHDYLSANGFAFSGIGNDDIAKSMAATSGWTTDPTAGNVGNTQATNNASGFTALPGGYRNIYGGYVEIGDKGHFYSSTANGATLSWYRSLNSNGAILGSNSASSSNGYSVRCLKN